MITAPATTQPFAATPLAQTHMVSNLATGEEHTYVGNSARDAIIAAHAQALGDWNTWNYERRYGTLPRLTTSGRFWSLGDFGVAVELHVECVSFGRRLNGKQGRTGVYVDRFSIDTLLNRMVTILAKGEEHEQYRSLDGRDDMVAIILKQAKKKAFRRVKS